MNELITNIIKNRTRLITLAILLVSFIIAIRGMETKDWVITLLRGLSVGAVTFLVASGFSLIFGLLDVLNLAHGTLFMIGAYVGWTVFVRPDTFLDLFTPFALLLAGFVLMPLWDSLIRRMSVPARVAQIWPWVGVFISVGILYFNLSRYPVTAWDSAVYTRSPVTYAFLADQGQLVLPEPEQFEGISPVVGIVGILVGGLLLAFSLAGLIRGRQGALTRQAGQRSQSVRPDAWILFGILVVSGLVVYLFNTQLTNGLVNLGTTWLFLIAIVTATLTGAGLGALMESTLIRPLYTRPFYQLMLTLGLSAIGIEIVRTIWGRPEFTMPKPALFEGTGEGCPAVSLADLLANNCSTILYSGGRLRTYNEIFIPLVGLVVLIAVWLLLQRTRIGMIIRAGVQDREMVEALGINVYKVFTLVFSLGVGLAALGGVIAAPSMGLSNLMGDSLLINALIALAIGGLTSYPGAAVGSILVGLLQQFIIKYGQIGINLPFLDAPFKPTPPLVPASTVLLMVIILLLLPQGLFGRKE